MRGLDLFDKVTRPTKKGIEPHLASQALEPFRLSLNYLEPEKLTEAFAQLTARSIEASTMGGDNPKLAIKALEIVAERAEREFAKLEQRVSESALPLPAPLRESLTAGLEFIDTLAKAFADPARKLLASGTPLPSFSGLDLGVFHAMRLLERRTMLSYRVWSAPPSVVWETLYEIYRAAFSQGLQRVAMGDSQETIEHVYARILLMALSEPPKASPGDLQRLDHLLHRFAHLTRISDALFVSPSAIAFSVGPKGPRSEVLREDQVRRGRDKNRMMIEVTELIDKVEEFTETFKLGYAPGDLELPEDADAQAWFALLERVHGHWTGNKTRRFERKAYYPRVDVIVGLKDIWNFLHGNAFRRRNEDRRDATAVMPASTEWAVTDQSAGGFALRLVSAACPPIGVGNIVAVRFRDHSAVYICIARRLFYRDLQSLELGLESLSPRAIPVYLSVAGKGETTRETALLFNNLPGRINAPVLMIAARRGQPSRYAELELPGGRKVIELGAPILKNAALALYRLTIAPNQAPQLQAPEAAE